MNPNLHFFPAFARVDGRRRENSEGSCRVSMPLCDMDGGWDAGSGAFAGV